VGGIPHIVELHEIVKELKDGLSAVSSNGDKRPPEQPNKCIPYPHINTPFVYLVDISCPSNGISTPLTQAVQLRIRAGLLSIESAHP